MSGSNLPKPQDQISQPQAHQAPVSSNAERQPASGVKPSWYFRAASLHDLEAMMNIERVVFPEDAWSAEQMRQELSSPWCKYFIAVPLGQPEDLDGYIGLALPRGEQ